MHRIDGPGATVGNLFTEGNPATAVPATDVTDDWLNDVQEELISILTAAGITPVKGDQNQVLEAIQKIASLQYATTFTGNLTLLPADAGKIFIYAAPADVTVTLPSLPSTDTGAVFKVINSGPNNVTLTRAGSDQIDAGLNTVNSIVIPPYRSLTIVRSAASLLWHAETAPVAVQQVLGNMQAGETFSGAMSAAVADAGKIYIYSGTGGHTATLPLVADTPTGAVYEFVNTGTGDLTVSRAGSDLIDVGPSTASTITVPAGQSLRLVRATGSSNWHTVNFSASSLLGSFGSSLVANNGWQRLPSGAILQWGKFLISAGGTFTGSFPVAFPTACDSFVVSHNGGATPFVMGGNSVSASQYQVDAFTLASGRANIGYNFFAVGR